ncbi:hypothetical protein RclHR1_30140001 [Rhizophagus clarus]|uniref:Protein kinase domain-containing protein n=1 Tax=Rhizophagus clarus TaxID=94130 RepID=A0A2Z6RKE6_9GLOM|nr:hypothetical protein RclHR1_30140001 [Rhizophagus clarus]
MFDLAKYYEIGEGIEINLEKAFYWYHKAAENGNKKAMFNLSNNYKNGEGTEKNLEKAFYWYQKAVEDDDEKAIYNLANFHENETAENDLEKAIYWYQNAAENGDKKAMYDLGVYYENKDMEKAIYWYQESAKNGNEKAMYYVANYYENNENLEKAFYWYQKAAEIDNEGSMYKLAICYKNGKGTEKSLEKAFYWYQKAVDNGQKEAIYELADCYLNGKGIEKNLEKALYWFQKAEKNDKISSKFKDEICKECKQPYVNYQWCQQCNSKRFKQDFSNWTSKNEYIDKFIQDAQLDAKNSYEVLEWIPYNKLSNINYYDEGGFGQIHKAIWLDGPIDSWNFNKQQWNRWNFQAGYEVILKTLNDSSRLDNEFLDEWKYHYNCQKKSFSKFIQLFGITQNPYNLNYVIVMSYAKKGNLRKCLSDIVKIKWQDKLQLLKKIILGLKVIHKSNLIHGDFHDGNILISDNHNELFIIDLGLCKPVSDLQASDKKVNEIYGVLPYMAPEILRNEPYTPASDIYSFSMIMWEFTSGIPPFKYEAHDHDLVLNICKGKRPEIIENTPICYINLMKKCWDSNPSNRPTIMELEYRISEWIRCFNEHYRINGYRNNYEIEVSNFDNELKNDMSEFVLANKKLVQEKADTSITQSHSQAYYTSRKLTEILLKEDSDYLEYMI